MSSRPKRPGGQPPPEVARLAGATVDLGPLAAEICRRYRAEFPDEHDLYGEAGVAWCLHDNRHILNWAIEAIEVGADLDHHLLWLADVLETRNFPIERLVRDLELAADVVRDLMPGVGPLEERLRTGAKLVAARAPLAGESDDAIAPGGALRRRVSDSRRPELARRYGEALRDGSARAAETVIEEALTTGVSGAEVQTEVIRPAMRWIGELWEQDALTVAEEHLATAISQQALIQLFPSLQAGAPHSRECILLAAVEGQHHVLGLRMIADVLEGAGFEVLYLGADVPVESLAQIVRTRRPAVIGLSCTFTAGSGFLVDAIIAIADSGVETRILLGGDGVAPELRDVGYPWLNGSIGVVEVVEELLGSPPPSLPQAIATLRRIPGARAEIQRATDYDGITEARLLDIVEGANEQTRIFARRAQDFHYLALHDALTQLPNRRAFDDRMIEFSRPEAEGVMLMIDLDHFKAVNDQHGHEAGDELLRAVGQAITAGLRSGDFAARTGGDEFAVLLPNAQPGPAALVAERIRGNIRRANDYGVTASIGLAPLTANPRAGLLAADEALYAAKEAGRDRFAAAERVGSIRSLVDEHPADRPGDASAS